MNLALRKPTRQSTVYRNLRAWPSGWYYYDSSLAVDGNKDTEFRFGSCIHTDNGDKSPWWMVDLVGHFRIRGVNMTNRGDHGKYRKLVKVSRVVDTTLHTDNIIHAVNGVFIVCKN